MTISHILRRPGRRGFTLLELIASLTASSVLLVGLSSAVFLALKAGDTSIGPFSNSHSGALAVLEITRDLQDATDIHESGCTSTSVEFTVPDRTGDGSPETIRYSWAGIAGGPLTRVVNGGSPVTIAADVQFLEFVHQTKTVSPPSVRTESAETLLIDQNNTNTGFATWRDLTSSSWSGEFIAPSLPTDAVDWKITRLRLTLASSSTTSGTVAVQLRAADATSLPTSLIVEETLLQESDFNGSWKEIAWSNASELPLEGVCIVLAHGGGSGTIGRVRSGFLSLSTSNTRLVGSSNGGSTWSSSSIEDLWLQVWGTYTTMGPGPDPPQYYRNRVDVSLRVGGNSRSLVRTSVYLPNEPEVSSP